MAKWFKRTLQGVGNRFVALLQYLIGEEPDLRASDAVFTAAFPPPAEQSGDKRVLARYRVNLPATLTYGIASSSEQTVVTNLNERGLFVYSSSDLAHGSVIQVEVSLPPELASWGKRRVRYHASVVRVERLSSGERFGIAAAIKRCDVLADAERAMSAKA
jgi:hypothetical protein